MDAAASALPSRDALAGYAKLLRGVLDDLPFAVVVVESDGRLTLWNGELATILSQSAPEGTHRDVASLILELGRLVVDPDAFERELYQALKEPAKTPEFEVALLDGGALAVGATPLRGSDGAHVVYLRDATGEIHARRELEHRALHDPLTSLPNRELLLDRLTVALARRVRQDTAVGVIFIDLDDFKQINDAHGHSVGDEVLVSVAQRLQSEVREGDTVARYGGDEFVVLCEDLVSEQTAGPLARRLGAAINQPVTAGGRLLAVSASIGVVVEGDPATDPDALLARADAEMYRHKRRAGRALGKH
ncbi:MAG: diguanylate cyclase [Solirubrobacteraceae bacterium]|jgi:diguanylate cyclase (GGDEF)-like protein